MIPEPPLPTGLRDLFADGGADGRALSTPLPPGRLAFPDEGGGRPVLWLTDGPAPPGLWARLRAEHPRSGLWPLLLAPPHHSEEFRPWLTGELMPGDMSSPDLHDPAALLSSWWEDHTGTHEDDMLSPADRVAVTAPHGRRWPGRAAAAPLRADPDREAGEYADALLSFQDSMRLGLVAAERGADALTAVGWTGPANYTNDTAEVSAVLRDWEHRFGARVVGVGFDLLHLSVAAPPATREHALAVAAEHFAFCPDNVWQGRPPHTLAAYAERLVDQWSWTFWWD
ncbi:DUF4253 domain-containing protein [Actinosynnema sp. NPDC059797]